jgi:molybdenum cofactor cytidylyltransferase
VIYAVIPAAGRSRRMGQPKLLMPWAKVTMIEHVLGIWTASPIRRAVVVVRPDDTPLADVCRRVDVDVVVPPVAPLDMKQSVRFALEHIAQHYRPSLRDSWLLAPADMPGIRVSTIDQVIARHQDQPQVVIVPTFQGRRGHPVLFPWTLAEQVSQLDASEGLNALVKRSKREEVESHDPGCVRDIDSPDDYRRMTEE